jgi:oligopeptide/dipeptide ABC transporter ATP-binding protein
LNPLLRVKDLNVRFHAQHIVKDVSFELEPGEVLGIIGESGSGKSVTALSIMKLLDRSASINGEIFLGDRPLLSAGDRELRKIRGSDISMIFQEPLTSLNPVLRIGDQIIESIKVHRDIKRKQMLDEVYEILNLVGIADPNRVFYSYPHQLSGGMRQRIMIAMAVINHPRILIADEPTTALDVTIQAQILQIIKNLRKKFGTAVILITHDLGVVADICDRVLVMYSGEVVEQRDIWDFFEKPLHPYSQGLLQSIPTFHGVPKEPLHVIGGIAANPANPPKGCSFHPRCSISVQKCSDIHPSNRSFKNTSSKVRCHLYDDFNHHQRGENLYAK